MKTYQLDDVLSVRDGRKYFIQCTCKGSSYRHMHEGMFETYWKSLNESEQQSLRLKAKWEQMSLSKVATEFGVASEHPCEAKEGS